MIRSETDFGFLLNIKEYRSGSPAAALSFATLYSFFFSFMLFSTRKFEISMFERLLFGLLSSPCPSLISTEALF